MTGVDWQALTAAGPDAWLAFVGRLHPLVLHLPLGVLPTLLLLELFALLRRRPMALGTRRALVAIGALGALTAATSGWLLAEESSYGGDAVEWHRYAGLATAGLASLAALSSLARTGRLYGRLLALSCLALLPAGHLGASMTHGDGFLWEPLQPARATQPREPVAQQPAAQPDDYATTIAPLLDARCGKCHGESRHKGGLSLHTPEGLLAGGENGPVLAPGDPAGSELLRRVMLPLEHDDHMPPASKPQPGAAELAELRAWIAAGAPFGAGGATGLATGGAAVSAAISAAGGASGSAAVHATTGATPEAGTPRVVVSAEALQPLDTALVHVETLDPASGLLWVSFAPRPDAGDALVAELLDPLLGAIGELSLAGTQVGDASLALAARMPRLEALDLSRTACTSAGLAALADAPSLRRLNLTGTTLDDDAPDALAALPALEHLAVWNTGPGAEAWQRVRETRPGLTVVDGAAPPAEPLEVEPEVEFVDYVAATAAATAPDLTPINTACPVSGTPIDPSILVVHDGRVIGFCCTECPSRFWADPAAFPVGE